MPVFDLVSSPNGGVGTLNGFGTALAQSIGALAASFGFNISPPHITTSPASDMTTLGNTVIGTGIGTGITNTGFTTGNTFSVTVTNPDTGVSLDVVTTITPTGKNPVVAGGDQAIEVSDAETFLLNEIDSAQRDLPRTAIANINYRPPKVEEDFFDLIRSVVKDPAATNDMLVDSLTNLIISSYVDKNFGHLSIKQKALLISESEEKFSKYFKKIGLIGEGEGTSPDLTTMEKNNDREISATLNALVHNDRNMYINKEYTRYITPGGFPIKLVFIQLYDELVGFIKEAAQELKLTLQPNSEQGGGSKQNNKGMFNYAHFIPLHNRSKKHNYAATKIKNNTRHRRRNKSSNKRRSRRS